MNDEIDLIHLCQILLRSKRLILWIVGGVTFVSMVVSLLLPKVYQAKATLLPVGGQKTMMSHMAAMTGQFGLLPGLIGTGEDSIASQLLVLLKSRTLAERVVEHNDIMSALYPNYSKKEGRLPTLTDAGATLLNMVTFEEDRKTGLITIDATARTPELAAKIANDYLGELTDYLNESTLTGAKRNRLFIENQLERNKVDLLESGKELSSFYEANKISNVVPSVDVDVSLNESGKKTEGSVEGLQEDLEATEAKISRAKIVKDVPQQIYLEYLTIRRTLLGQINILLAQQYEMAKIEAAKEDLSFQVIDWARVPIRKFKPKRRQIVMASFTLSLLGSIFFAFFMEYLEKVKTQS